MSKPSADIFILPMVRVERDPSDLEIVIRIGPKSSIVISCDPELTPPLVEMRYNGERLHLKADQAREIASALLTAAAGAQGGGSA